MPTGYGQPTLCRFLSLLTLFTLFQWFQPVLAVQQNFTIDDQGGDSSGIVPVYAPPSAWSNQACVGCAIDPDPQNLHEGTAMSATFSPESFPSTTLDFDFNGMAIYIYFTLFYNEGDGITVNTECNFTLDNGPRVFFNHSGDPRKPRGFRDYNSLVYSRTDLAPGQHHMTISMSDVSYHVFLSFDYALYTVDLGLDIPGGTSSVTNSTPLPTNGARPFTQTPVIMQSASSSTPTPNKPPPDLAGIIAGGVVGGLAIIAGFILILYFYRRDVRRTQQPPSPDPTIPRPFIVTNSTSKRGQSEEASSRYLVHQGNSSASGSSRGGRTTPATSSSSRSTSAPLLNIHESVPMVAQSLSSSGSGSRSGQASSVEHQIQAATRRMHSLREEIASNSGRTVSSRRTNGSIPRGTRELIEEVKRLRQEIQSLKEMRRAPAATPQLQQQQSSTDYGPPPIYSDGLAPP